MIQTWITDVTPLLEQKTCKYYYDRLPEWRRRKADKLKNLNKAQSVGAWILYQNMRAAYGLSEGGIYNLSHSGRYALCAADDGKGNAAGAAKEPGYNGLQERSEAVKVGCDVEMIKKLRPGVARRFFCPDEEAYIMGQETETCRTEEFYRYWVLKESFIKAVREGMRLDLRSFEIKIEKGEPVLIRQPENYPEKYYYKEYKLEAGDAKIAVCSTEPEFGRLEFVTDLSR